MGMDEMHLGNNKYISTKRAAKITGYAQDYIGQMVRTGKVKATKVGRSWFVLEADALRLSGKPAALKSPERALAELESRKANTKTESKISFSVEYPKTWSQVQYFSEEEPLLPISGNRESFINKHSIEILDEHRVRISTASSGGLNSSLSNGLLSSSVKAQSFDGVRYEAESTVPEASDDLHDTHLDRRIDHRTHAPESLMIGTPDVSATPKFDVHWIVRVAVSAIIVSFLALLIPIL
jgi:hypothetical protein